MPVSETLWLSVSLRLSFHFQNNNFFITIDTITLVSIPLLLSLLLIFGSIDQQLDDTF